MREAKEKKVFGTWNLSGTCDKNSLVGLYK